MTQKMVREMSLNFFLLLPKPSQAKSLEDIESFLTQDKPSRLRAVDHNLWVMEHSRRRWLQESRLFLQRKHLLTVMMPLLIKLSVVSMRPFAASQAKKEILGVVPTFQMMLEGNGLVQGVGLPARRLLKDFTMNLPVLDMFHHSLSSWSVRWTEVKVCRRLSIASISQSWIFLWTVMFHCPECLGQ